MTAKAFGAVCSQRLAGCVLGSVIGDALGMPVEGWDKKDIYDRYGFLDQMVSGRLQKGSYTDDSQMMLGVLETLAHKGFIDQDYLIKRFIANFQEHRGYGRRTIITLSKLARGISYHNIDTDSWANGGAMRVGVLGAFFADDETAIYENAIKQCEVTHSHPYALAGSLLQAQAVGLAARLGADKKTLTQKEFLDYLGFWVRKKDDYVAKRLMAMPDLKGLSHETACERLTGEYACDVRAEEAVCPALGCFIWAQSFKQAVMLAVSLGGDTDTIGAMTGAISGAYWGFEGLNQKWLDDLEQGEKGKDYFLSLCEMAIKTKKG